MLDTGPAPARPDARAPGPARPGAPPDPRPDPGPGSNPTTPGRHHVRRGSHVPRDVLGVIPMTGTTARLLEQAMDEMPDAPASVDPQHVLCGLSMVGPNGPVPCDCHRYCDPVVCEYAAGFACDVLADC